MEYKSLECSNVKRFGMKLIENLVYFYVQSYENHFNVNEILVILTDLLYKYNNIEYISCSLDRMY